jgi:cytochrome P450
MPPFHGERMRAYGSTMANIARRHAQSWEKDRPFSMQEAAREISLDVILEAVLGVDQGESRARFRQAMLDLMQSMSPAVLALRPLQKLFGKRGPMGRFDRAKAHLRTLVAEEVNRRRSNGVSGEDILSMLLAARHEDGNVLDEPELFGHMLTLLIAGHDTTATALAWAMYFIHREPEVRARLLTELAQMAKEGDGPAPAELANQRYLDAVTQESQRLRPLVPVISRKLARPFSLLGHELPVGIHVGACASLIHHRPELYPEPERFRPERFMERAANAFEYFPFGGGARRCIGAAFAQYEMKIVLGTVLHTRQLELVDKVVQPRLQFGTVGPAKGVRMVAG